ncbi:MAG: type secretion system protein [Schlesneria sp.]|nr:type secretion system protein [Schlesneria sp.]
MKEGLAAGAFLAVAIALLNWWKNARRHGEAERRLADEVELPFEEEDIPPQIPISLRRYRWVSWLIGCLVLCGLAFGLQLGATLAIAAALIVALLGAELEAMWAERTIALIEQQLSDAIDLMCSTLKSGGSVVRAFESAVAEARSPLRPELEEVVGRIRLGDAPQSVMMALAERIPLEAFRLFATALAVHWEVGGSLAPTLATVGRTIRDRIEIARRIRTMSSQSRVSIIAVLSTSYAIGVIMWRNDPERMHTFLSTSLGQNAVALAVVLQVGGIVWSSTLSKIRF